MTSSSGRYTSRREAIIAGQAAAIRSFARLGLSYEDRVDIFGIIESEPLWLLFQRLDKLYGAYCSLDQTAAVLVHGGHGPALQRFTAAHEYGHHVLEHEPTLDFAEAITEGRSDSLEEAAAQAFAGDFLMPVALFDRCRARLSLGDDLTPAEAYQLSLELGTSLPATRTRLEQLKRITPDAAHDLGQVRPKELKQQAAGRSDVGRADVWTVDETSLDRHPVLHVGDELHVRLPENPSTGYRWECVTVGQLQTIGDEVEQAQPARVGQGAVRHLSFAAPATGVGLVELELRRAWASGPPQRSVSLTPSIVEAGPPWDEPGLRSSLRQSLMADRP